MSWYKKSNIVSSSLITETCIEDILIIPVCFFDSSDWVNGELKLVNIEQSQKNRDVTDTDDKEVFTCTYLNIAIVRCNLNTFIF